MQLFRNTIPAGPVPVGLLTAAIDLINCLKPAPRDIDHIVTTYVLRLAYDRTTAAALVARIHACARMFVDPRWPAVRHLGRSLQPVQRIRFEEVVQTFIALTPLHPQRGFNVSLLLKDLTKALPASGRC